MAGAGKLTDLELLNLIQKTAQRSPEKKTNPTEQEKPAEIEESRKEKNQTETAVDGETKSDRDEYFTCGPLSDIVKMQTNEQCGFKQLGGTATQSNFQETVTHSNEASPDQEETQSLMRHTVAQSMEISQMPQSNVVQQLQTEPVLSENSEIKPPLREFDDISEGKRQEQTDVIISVKEVTQKSATTPAEQTKDPTISSPGKSMPVIDLTSPSYKIDAELVAMLSKEEITNLVHEYRTELDSTKSKLVKCQRQLKKSNDYNDVLRNMVEQLSSEIHRLKNAKTCSVHVQVDKEDFLVYTTGRSTMPSWKAGDDLNSVPMDINLTEEPGALSESVSNVEQVVTDTGAFSIADSIKEAAEAVVQQQQADMLQDSGYVYDETSGLYYHSASGYYYDQQKSLFYDPKTGIYYYYDYNTGEYVFHSQVALPSQTQATGQSAFKVDNAYKKKYSDARRSAKPSKRNKARERLSSEERVHMNRKERRKAEQERYTRYDRRNGRDRYRKEHSRGIERKRRRYSSYSSESSRSGSRSRNSSCEVRRKRSRSGSRPSRSPAPVERGDEKRHRRKRKNKSKKRKKEKKRDKGSETHSGQSDVQAIEDNQTKKLKNASNATKRAKDKVLVETSKINAGSNEAEEFENSENAKSLRVHSDRGSDDDSPVMNIAEACELESETELMIIEDESSKEKEEIEDKSVNNAEIDTKTSKQEQEKNESDEKSMQIHSPGGRHRKKSHRGSKSRKKKKSHHKKKSKKKKKRKTKDKQDSESGTESGELSDTDSEYSSVSESYSSYSSERDGEDMYVDIADTGEPEETEVAVSYPPCIRVMVTESDCLDVGSLHIVTCTGAKIGREQCDICIPDINVSKVHAEIRYNESSREYVISDHASQNGTFLNNQRLSPAKIASEPYVVSHGGCVMIGATKLLCHIHPGSDTCDQCEPGVVMATHKALQPQAELKVLTKEERLRQKKQEMNQIKKKYGLKNAAYENNPEVFNNPNYADKAEERRKHVGSDVPGQKSEAPASVHRPISSGNVGHKLLQKMGWKEGDSLGKNNSGIQEPISVTLRASQKAGLGSTSAGGFTAEDANTVDIKKASRRVQAQQRYRQIETGNSKSEDNSKEKVWTQGDTEYT